MVGCRITLLGVFLLSLPVWGAGTKAERHFLEKVKPLLESRCVSCHGAEKQKGGLRLDSRAAVLKGGETGAGVVPGKPSESLILQAVTHVRADLEMPPKEKLTARDVAVLERWINEGAPWPEDRAMAAATQASGVKAERIGDAWSDRRNPIVRIFGGQRLELWSLKPVTRREPPAVTDGKWVRNSIDAFVLAKLEEKGLRPAGEADRRTLIRRVTFDLTGLPPTPEEVAAFVGDESGDAYERLVERLLASPRYGEHWARQWLDVVRYSDSNGFDWDEFRPQAWRFRDYVVRSLNADKPFDQFVKEQLAGDEMLAEPPRTAEEQDRLIATGYLRLGPQDNSAPLFNEQARSRAELMTDLVDTTASAFLGLSLSCARCHDHKYDPISQADYYRMRAFFEPVKYADDVAIDLAAEQEAIRKHNEGVDARIKPVQARRQMLLDAVKGRVREERESLKASEAAKKKGAPSDREVLAALSAEEKAEYEAQTRQIEGLKKQKRAFTHGLAMTDGEKAPVTKILLQGDYKREGAAVEAGFLSILDPNPAVLGRAKNPKTTGRRLALAEWIVSPRNPLTARVIVNRVWQGHFGRGLVETANDFGLAGARPTHPELLDWLAAEFVKQGWSLKKLHRVIVTSTTYRQASVGTSDGQDELLGRYPMRRLSAEQLRDALLAVSGLLKAKAGGPPVWPELPAEVLRANPAFLDDNAEKTKGWYPSPVGERNVRSVYLVQKRTVRVPFMETFDLPENAVSCPRRTESTVAPQALSLMNGAVAVEAARAMAKRVEGEVGKDVAGQVRRAFELALQRRPEEGERERCEAFVRERSLLELCRALVNLNEFVYVD